MPGNFRQSELTGAAVLVDFLQNPESVYGLCRLFAMSTLVDR